MGNKLLLSREHHCWAGVRRSGPWFSSSNRTKAALRGGFFVGEHCPAGPVFGEAQCRRHDSEGMPPVCSRKSPIRGRRAGDGTDASPLDRRSRPRFPPFFGRSGTKMATAKKNEKNACAIPQMGNTLHSIPRVRTLDRGCEFRSTLTSSLVNSSRPSGRLFYRSSAFRLRGGSISGGIGGWRKGGPGRRVNRVGAPGLGTSVRPPFSSFRFSWRPRRRPSRARTWRSRSAAASSPRALRVPGRRSTGRCADGRRSP